MNYKAQNISNEENNYPKAIAISTGIMGFLLLISFFIVIGSFNIPDNCTSNIPNINKFFFYIINFCSFKIFHISFIGMQKDFLRIKITF